MIEKYIYIYFTGTTEYTQGLVEHVTVLIGVAVGKTAIGGVIHQPYYKNDKDGTFGRTLWGINGAGYGGFVPILPPEGKRIITTTRYQIISMVTFLYIFLFSSNVL